MRVTGLRKPAARGQAPKVKFLHEVYFVDIDLHETVQADGNAGAI